MQRSRRDPCRRACKSCPHSWLLPTIHSPPYRARRPPRHRRGVWQGLAGTRSLSCVGSQKFLGKEQDERPLLQPVPFIGVGDVLDLFFLVEDLVGIVVGLQQRNGASALHFLINLVVVDGT